MPNLDIMTTQTHPPQPICRVAIKLSVFSLILSLFSLSVSATTHYVTVNGASFSPATLTIDVGDTVVWENTDDFFSHSTTSDLDLLNTGYWNGWLVELGDTYAHAFENPGTFSYHDQFDYGTGTITVISPSTAVIRLDSPRQEAGQFRFDATGLTVGKTNVLETSVDLTSWQPIATNVASSATLTVTNSIIPTRRFFRLLELH
jgi:plastocyanin